ncbi:hypothetical protein AHAS_Ahas18G0155100 [Arachis hypogaea]
MKIVQMMTMEIWVIDTILTEITLYFSTFDDFVFFKSLQNQSLVQSAKETHTKKQINPFLRLVDDHKLQVFSTACDGSTIAYESKEDDYRASNLLPELMTLTQKIQEFFVSEIIQYLEVLEEANNAKSEPTTPL